MAQDAHTFASLTHAPLSARLLLTRRVKISELHNAPANTRKRWARVLVIPRASLAHYARNHA
jgi:hypothetical protein